jgi:hypothetical protein
MGRWIEPGACLALSDFERFDAIFIQHDNSKWAETIHLKHPRVYRFFSTYHPQKHGPLRPKFDFVARFEEPILHNVHRASLQFFDGYSSDLGIVSKISSSYRQFPNRVVIHPTSSDPVKNWHTNGFYKLASLLEKRGLEPVFAVSPSERRSWPSPLFSSLEELVLFVGMSGGLIGNDSGLAHLASALYLPTLVIGPCFDLLQHWQPGWYPATKVLAPAWCPRKLWPWTISARQVLSTFVQECRWRGALSSSTQPNGL